MRTVSLRRRSVAAATGVVAGALAGASLFVTLSLRAHLEGDLDALLAERASTARVVAGELAGEALAERLQMLGVRATVTTAEGDTFVSAPRLQRTAGRIAAPDEPSAAALVTREVDLPGGGAVTVAVARDGVDRALRRLVVLQALAVGLGTLVAAGVAAQTSRVALRPLEDVVATAERTTAGATGGRLGPDRTDTELGRLAAAFDAMLDRLDDALSRAQASDERSRRFLADAAHQLRTPLAAAKAGAEALLRSDRLGPDERERFARQIAAETARAGGLIRDLLVLARLDQGAAPATEPVDLADLARSEVERAAAIAGDLDLTVDAPRPVAVEADPDGLADALANLLDNARRHARRSVSVRVGSAGGLALVTVRDDGPGLDPAQAERAFERFSSLDGHGGTGLGLPIAREIARAHGGDLTYAAGAFTLALPASGGG